MRKPPSPTSPTTAAFTLVELLIVVVLLGILSAIALPSARADRSEAVKSTLKANVQNVGMLLEYRRQQSEDGSFPPALQDDWFAADSLPSHPDKMADVPVVETVAIAGVAHPSSKVIGPGSAGAYWYNTETGAFRARVKALATDPETLAFYNAVNGSAAATLAAVLDTRGVSGSGSGSGGAGTASTTTTGTEGGGAGAASTGGGRGGR